MSTDTHPTNPKPIPPPTVVRLPPPTAVKLQVRDPNLRLKSALKKRPSNTPPTPPTPTRTCCCCLTWFVTTLLLLSLLVGATCGVFWILYRPQRPKFTIASLRLSNLTLTGNPDTDASGQLYTSGNLTISARNPNSRLTALYDVVSMSVFSNASKVLIANATLEPFRSAPGNSTVLRFVFRNWRTLDLEAARGLESELAMGKRSVSAIGELETRMGVQIGKWRSRKIGIRVTCLGLRVKKKRMKMKGAVSESESDDGKCEVHLSNKIWRFTF